MDRLLNISSIEELRARFPNYDIEFVSQEWMDIYRNLRFFLKFVFPVLAGVAGLGSLLVLITLITRRKVTKLPVTINITICTLLTVDILYLIKKTLILHNYQWLTYFPCSRYPVSLFLVHGQTLLLFQGYIQCTISFERLLAVVSPLRVRRLVTPKRLVFVLILVLSSVLAIQVAFFPNFYSPNVNGTCNEYEFYPLKFAIFDSILYCGIPSLILFSCSFSIIYTLFTRKRCGRVVKRFNDSRLAVILLTMGFLYFSTTLAYSISHYAPYTCCNDNHTKRFFWVTVLELLPTLGAMTDWIILLCLGRQIRRAVRGLLLRKSIISSIQTQSEESPEVYGRNVTSTRRSNRLSRNGQMKNLKKNEKFKSYHKNET